MAILQENIKIKLPADVTEDLFRFMFSDGRRRRVFDTIIRDNMKKILKNIVRDSESAVSQFHSENVKILYGEIIASVAAAMESNISNYYNISYDFRSMRLTVQLSLFDFDLLRKKDIQKQLAAMYERKGGMASFPNKKPVKIEPLSNFKPAYSKTSVALFDILTKGTKGHDIKPRPTKTFLGGGKSSKRPKRGGIRQFLLIWRGAGQYGFSKEYSLPGTKQIGNPVIVGKNNILKYTYRQQFKAGVERGFIVWVGESINKFRKIVKRIGAW